MSFSWQSARLLQGFPPIYFPTGFLLNHRNAESKYHILQFSGFVRRTKHFWSCTRPFAYVLRLWDFDSGIKSSCSRFCVSLISRACAMEARRIPINTRCGARCAPAEINKCVCVLAFIYISAGWCGKSVSRRKYYFLAADQFSLWALRPPHISTTCRMPLVLSRLWETEAIQNTYAPASGPETHFSNKVPPLGVIEWVSHTRDGYFMKFLPS